MQRSAQNNVAILLAVTLGLAGVIRPVRAAPAPHGLRALSPAIPASAIPSPDPLVLDGTIEFDMDWTATNEGFSEHRNRHTTYQALATHLLDECPEDPTNPDVACYDLDLAVSTSMTYDVTYDYNDSDCRDPNNQIHYHFSNHEDAHADWLLPDDNNNILGARLSLDLQTGTVVATDGGGRDGNKLGTSRTWNTDFSPTSCISGYDNTDVWELGSVSRLSNLPIADLIGDDIPSHWSQTFDLGTADLDLSDVPDPMKEPFLEFTNAWGHLASPQTGDNHLTLSVDSRLHADCSNTPSSLLQRPTPLPTAASPHQLVDFAGSPASCQGVAITSPPADSIIAKTDATLFSPQPIIFEREPKTRQLRVDGTAPSGAREVRVNGLAAPAANGTWSIQIPAPSPGNFHITATADGKTAEEDVTVIDLIVSSPREDQGVAATDTSLAISVEPEMPTINAISKALGYPGGEVSTVPLEWELSIDGHQRTRVLGVGDPGSWKHYTLPFTGTTRDGSIPWIPDFGGQIVGGVARIQVTANLPGVLHEPVISEPRWFDIHGSNPTTATVQQYTASIDADNSDVLDHIWCKESQTKQFGYEPPGRPWNVGPDPRQPPDVAPDDYPTPGVLRPLYGAPPAGVGLAQKDPATLQEQWDWKANVRAGDGVYRSALTIARRRASNERERIANELAQSVLLINTLRSSEGLPLLTAPPLPTVRDLTELEKVRSALRGYNAGPSTNQYSFDRKYTVDFASLDLVITGNADWYETYTGDNVNYPNEVLSCGGPILRWGASASAPAVRVGS